MSAPRVTAIVLAAGAGRRLGQPKALVAAAGGQSWLAGAVEAVRQAGASEVVVVVGAEGDRVAATAPPGVTVVRADEWSEGMGASLRAGLAAVAAAAEPPAAVVVMVVDTPAVGAAVVRRLLALADEDVLARATYDGLPGHPVVIGRVHLAGVAASAVGDRGARAYLAEHGAVAVECADLAVGADIDTPEQLRAWREREAGA